MNYTLAYIYVTSPIYLCTSKGIKYSCLKGFWSKQGELYLMKLNSFVVWLIRETRKTINQSHRLYVAGGFSLLADCVQYVSMYLNDCIPRKTKYYSVVNSFGNECSFTFYDFSQILLRGVAFSD